MLGRIYTIKCSVDPRVYVGSTYMSLEDRFRKHVNCCNIEETKHRPLYQAMNEYGSDKFTIELLEEIDDCDKAILRNIEGMHIEMHQESLIPLFNKNIAGRDKKQYCEDNKDKIKQYHEAKKEYKREYDKQYYEDNRERISEHKKQTTICECGATVRRSELKRHKRSHKHVKWESSK